MDYEEEYCRYHLTGAQEEARRAALAPPSPPRERVLIIQEMIKLISESKYTGELREELQRTGMTREDCSAVERGLQLAWLPIATIHAKQKARANKR